MNCLVTSPRYNHGCCLAHFQLNALILVNSNIEAYGQIKVKNTF